ncbi:unnamed protein product [Adineta steineri]|uniref:Uncharacterized protein n=1 Tax=Adineta steineri TaxID=433720 RepID=A0A813XPX3_9BILA|nr:unnamed protein product [Adineta steineri]
MHFVIYCRIRTLFLWSFLIFVLLVGYIVWPWFHAALIWNKSTIDFPIVSPLNNPLVNVPAIIHQTYRNAHAIPSSWKKASQTCQDFHPNYEYRLWTDADARRLIEKEFPCLLSTFDSYPYDIQRADVIRLIVLYVYGGIYLDLDIICLQSLDQLRTFEFVIPKTMPVGLSNDFIVAQPRHPFLLQILNNLPKYNRNYFTKYSTVMFSTGPMFLTQQASSYSNRSSIDVLSQELYGKYVHNSTRSLFRHLKASSWHGNDAAAIKWIYRQRIACFAVLFTLIVMTFALISIVQYRLTIIKLFRKDPSIVKSKLRKQSFTYDKIDPTTLL